MYLCRCRGRDRPVEAEDGGPSSIPFLSRHIQNLKKRVRRFEEQFEEEMKYKVLQGGGSLGKLLQCFTSEFLQVVADCFVPMSII